jgi:undecaprenyl-diphosphatase
MKRLLDWDEATIVAMARRRRGWANRPMWLITHAADHMSYWVHTALAFLFFGPMIGVMLGLGSGGAATVAQVFKRSIRRRRPDVAIAGFEALDANPDRFSFPSGHTCGTVGAATALAWGLPPLACAYGAFAALVGFSRVYLGAHYPLDVLGGALIGAVSGTTIGWVLREVWPLLPF